MGMAASQARFLGLTARKTNVEYEGQQINQQRTALSNSSASYYSNLLNMEVPICPSVENYTKTIYSFTDGSLSNTITSLIAKSDGSFTVSYLRSYQDDNAVVKGGSANIVTDDKSGVYKIGASELKILGDKLHYEWIVREETGTYRLYSAENGRYTYTDNDKKVHTLIPASEAILTLVGPEPKLDDYDVGPLISDYTKTQCYADVGSSTVGIGHMEHNLCRLMWSDGTQSITSRSGVTLTKTAQAKNYYSLTNANWRTSTDQTSIDLQKALKTYYPEKYQDLVDNYINTILYLNQNACATSDGMKINPNFYTLSTTDYDETALTGSNMLSEWKNNWDEVADLDYSGPYDEAHRAWVEDCKPYMGKYYDLQDMTYVRVIKEKKMFYDGDDEYLKSLSSDQLEKLYGDELNWKEQLDKKYGPLNDEWYVRYVKNTSTGAFEPQFYSGDEIVGGVKDEYSQVRTNVNMYKIGSETVNNEIKGVKAYLEQDSTGRYINITLKDDLGNMRTYALSTSTVKDDKAYDDAMNQYEYDKAVYDKNIQEINAKIEIIQAEDKNLEIRLKQLDTEQDAIQNELDAVSKVIEKNVESSFKTFG